MALLRSLGGVQAPRRASDIARKSCHESSLLNVETGQRKYTL